MQYKVLKSVAHNFTHSFMSFNNYVDEGYAIDDLRKLVRDTGRVTIHWIPESPPDAGLTPRLIKSIGLWRESLQKIVSSMGSDLSLIRDFRTEVYLKENHQIAVEGVLTDNRGRVYIASVFDF